MQQRIVPTSVEEVTSTEWLERVLSRRHPGVRVATVDVVEIQETLATKVRIACEAESDSGPVPSAYCVKGYLGEEGIARSWVGRPEALFYQVIAPKLRTRLAPCVFAHWDASTGHNVVVMDDLYAQGARFLTALSPYSVDQVADSLAELARVHAAHWDDIDLQGWDWLDHRLDDLPDFLPVDVLQELLDGPRGEPLARKTRDAARLRRAVASLLEHGRSTRRCLVHGDAHAGNVFVDAHGRPGFVDWQVVHRGAWALDVAYHIGAVLDVTDREAAEADLLAHYLDRLAGAVDDPPTWDVAWDEYRRHLVYGYFMWAVTRSVEPAITEEFVRRLGLAVEAHDSMTLLGAQ